MPTPQTTITSEFIGIQGPPGVPGEDGAAWVPPYRTVTGTSATPTAADDGGQIDFTSNSAVTVTANDLGAGKAYTVWQMGTGQLTVVAGSGVTLVSGSENATFKTPRRYSALVVRCRGDGTVIVLGEQPA